MFYALELRPRVLPPFEPWAFWQVPMHWVGVMLIPHDEV